VEGNQSILEPGQPALRRWLAAQGQPIYRVKQIRQWLFQRRADTWQAMTSLPKSLRAELAGQFQIWTTEPVACRRARDGTVKLLLRLADGQQVECVLLPGQSSHAICLSSQVGCAMGCVFCATGLDGMRRNLRAAEIVEQALRLQQQLPADHRISHVVVMGMGEPLANLNQLLPALDEIRRPDGLAISTRRITISTVGLPAAMRRLAEHGPHYPLAVSLHAPTDALRNQLVPINRTTTLDRVMAAADVYFAASGRRLTYEYVLLAGVNDTLQHAAQLASLLAGRPAMLNLIPYNPVAGLPYRIPTSRAVERFRTALADRGINIQLRRRKGEEIDAACGQLRRRSTAAD
jgi:23S rRNA (adenine2503-C2)-methyltransferase